MTEIFTDQNRADNDRGAAAWLNTPTRVSRKLLSTALVLLFGAGSIQAQTGNGPTIDDTLEWLTNNLSLLTIVHRYRNTPGDTDFTLSYKWWPINMKGCNMSIGREETNDWRSPTVGNGHQVLSANVTIQLSTIASVTHSQGTIAEVSWISQGGLNEPVWMITMTSRSNNIRIDCTSGCSNGAAREYRMGSRDKDMTQRIATALSHAVQLCGGSKEPF